MVDPITAGVVGGVVGAFFGGKKKDKKAREEIERLNANYAQQQRAISVQQQEQAITQQQLDLQQQELDLRQQELDLQQRQVAFQPGNSYVTNNVFVYNEGDSYDNMPGGGYNNGGYNSGGYNNSGYNSGGYNSGGYNDSGYDSVGYSNAPRLIEAVSDELICDNCGVSFPKHHAHYHCYICNGGDFDLCQSLQGSQVSMPGRA